MEELAQSNVEVVDHGDAWSEQDKKDLITHTLMYAQELYPEEELV